MSITVRGVVKHYGVVPALRGIDLDVATGRSTVLLGPSGCGKTTLLRCIAGLERPDAGAISIAGTTVFSKDRYIPPERRYVGFVHQSYALWPHLSVRGNVAYPLKARGWTGNRIEERVTETLQLVQMGWAADRFPGALSGGQQQRVALARALAFEPQILLLDEPLSNLDLKLREEMRYEIRSLQQRLGVTMVYVTHDQSEAMAIGDRLVVMEDGLIAQVGEPDQIYDRPASTFVASFIGMASFIEGTVTERDGETCLVELPGVGRASVAVAGDVRVGDGVTLCLRPHWVRVRPNDGDRKLADAVANAVTYYGPHTEVLASVQRTVIRAHLPGQPVIRVGDPIELYYRPEEVRLLRGRPSSPIHSGNDHGAVPDRVRPQAVVRTEGIRS